MDAKQLDAVADSLNAEATRLGKKIHDGMAQSKLGYDAFTVEEWQQISDDFAALQKRQREFFESLGLL